MSVINKDLGVVTAYAYAVEAGYTGTEEEFEQALGDLAELVTDFENFTVEVTTLEPGSSATASYANGVLSLGIPEGEKGDTGATPNLTIGTVTTLAPGSSATATITGTDEAPVLSFGIPEGDPGEVPAAALASDFSASVSYKKGDYVWKSGTLYEFTSDHAAGAWTGSDATAAKVADDVSDLKSALYEIREPKQNIGYFTQFDNYKHQSGVYVSYVSKNILKFWGQGTGWVRFNLLLGNEQVSSGYPTYTTNLPAGTYTIKKDNDLYVMYGTSSSNAKRWENGTSITLDSPVCVYLATKSNSYNFGTDQSPTLFELEIYNGNVPIIPTAIDNVARNIIGEVSCDKVIAKADFDYDRPYNIFNGTTYTENKKVDYLSGNLQDDTGRYATDYIEIDPAQGYICLNIYVYLMGESDSGLVTGGNRVWVHSNYAFYDKDKVFISYTGGANDTSKAIPINAKYVRLTLNSLAVMPYAILFYGYYTGQKYVRYTSYRKEIVEESVYASTGWESLNMVMFGDSITQGAPALTAGLSYTDYANDYLRSNIINVGLGGTRMSQGLPDAVGLGSFASLCEDIVSTSATAWDALEEYAETVDTTWANHVATLKAIDWTNIHAIGLLYGANDWHNSVPVGTEYNEVPTKYDGACAYGLKLLLTKYPHLQVIIFTPFFRISGETNSDADNGAGLNMDDYGASLKHIQPIFHCPIVDSGNELGINRYTIYTYSPDYDGTHPRKLIGNERIGRFVAEAVKRYIQPY